MIESAQLYYVFSFMFDAVPFATKVQVSGQNRVLGEYLLSCLQNEPTHYYPTQHIHLHVAEEEEPARARSALYLQFHHLSIDSHKEEVRVKEHGTVIQSCHLALFESGMGLMWVAIDIPTSLSEQRLSSLIGRGGFPVVSPMAANDQRSSVYQIFYSKVARLRELLEAAIRALEPAEQQKLERRPKQWNPTTRVLSVSWIEQDAIGKAEVLWTERRDATPDGVFQEPSVVAMLKVTPADRDMLDRHEPEPTQIFRTVFGILHGVPTDYGDPLHGVGENEMHLRNLFPDRRFKTYMHGNCLVVAHSEASDSLELKEFSLGLFRTFVAFRGCWYYYVLANELLDQKNEALFNQFLALVSGQLTASELRSALHRKRQDIVEERASFLRCLAVEDPLVRSIGLTPFSALYQAGCLVLRLEEAREIVHRKFHELDNLYNMVNAHLLQTEYGRSSKELPSNILSRLIWIVFAVFCAVGTGLLFVSQPAWIHSVAFAFCIIAVVLLPLAIAVSFVNALLKRPVASQGNPPAA